MTTILADSFTSALSHLTHDEQKQVKLTAFDLQTNPDQPRLQFHRIDKSKDPNFWSVRVNRDLRIIIHKRDSSVLLAYVDHHDDAYAWAERRRIEEHPRTGAIQIVEVRERIDAIAAPKAYVQADLPFDALAETSPLLFASLSPDDLLSIGVPIDWLPDILGANEEQFFSLAGHLPKEASEGLLDYAATGILKHASAPVADPLEHPDTQRRFRVLDDLDELKAALDAPFEQWTVFLHPSQRGVVERDYSGPARVAGSAGTGKTVVALHRVMRLLRNDAHAKVLLTTFSAPLARALTEKLGILLGDRPGVQDRVVIGSFADIAAELFTIATGRKPHLITGDAVRNAIGKAAEALGVIEFTPQFLFSEWTHVIDAWQIDTLEAYAEVPRMGRKNRLGTRQRERLWSVFSAVRENLTRRAMNTEAGLFAAATAIYRERGAKPFTHIVVDEAQDLGVAELRMLAVIAPEQPDALFFAGDLGQRIFQQPFSWRGLGVDVRGRSATLKVNYRTSHQIRRAADRLLPRTVRDIDGLGDDRTGAISVFDGPEPTIIGAIDEAEETSRVAAFLMQALEEGVTAGQIGIFVRSAAQLSRARAAAMAAGLAVRSSGASKHDAVPAALVGTMHLAKGLEFRVVIVMACDEKVLPLAARIADVADEFELDEVMATERQLFYVAATRARDRLLVSGVVPVSEFLDDFADTSV